MSSFKSYPSALPMAMQAGYTARHKPNMVRTTMADGHVRQRLVNQGAPDTVSVQIMMSEKQYRIFIRWYKTEIRCGADWFVMPLLSVDSPGTIQYRHVRIQNGELTATVVSANKEDGVLYRIAMTLDSGNTIVDDGAISEYRSLKENDDLIAEIRSEIAEASVIDDPDELGIIGTFTFTKED